MGGEGELVGGGGGCMLGGGGGCVAGRGGRIILEGDEGKETGGLGPSIQFSPNACSPGPRFTVDVTCYNNNDCIINVTN